MTFSTLGSPCLIYIGRNLSGLLVSVAGSLPSQIVGTKPSVAYIRCRGVVKGEVL